MSDSELESTPAPPTSSTPRPVWMLPLITGVAGLVLGGVVVGMGGILTTGIAEADDEAARSTVFADVLKACNLKDDANSEIADEGYTLTVESRGVEDIAGLEYNELACILEKLNTPRAVMAHFEQTTSMDGRQTESWDDYTLSWSYHPDRGADFIVTIESPEQ